MNPTLAYALEIISGAMESDNPAAAWFALGRVHEILRMEAGIEPEDLLVAPPLSKDDMERPNR